MHYEVLREELRAYYLQQHESIALDCKKRCWDELDRRVADKSLSAMEHKEIQYDGIPEFVAPQIFRNSFFYYETGTIPLVGMNWSTGAWTYTRNKKAYDNVDPRIAEEKEHCINVPVYMICGQYTDEMNHFAFDMKEILQNGIAPLYQRAVNAANTADCEEKASFYHSMATGLRALGRISESFSNRATQLLQIENDPIQRNNLLWIAETAKRVPWEAPQTFREALNTIVLLQNAIPTLEGGSLESMGRLDVLLYPFFQQDLANGIATEEEMYSDICDYLVLWDSRWEDSWKQMDNEVNDPGYTYTLGGCDQQGKPVYNRVTMLFLKANHETKVLYPKIKCRFDSKSPEEYLRLINTDISQGRTTIIYQNDETFIPALVHCGIKVEDARDYWILGCWEPVIPKATNEHCGYISLLKILELSVYGDFNRLGMQLQLETLNGEMNYEEVYQCLLRNIRSVLLSRRKVAMAGRPYWHQVDPHPIYSSVLDDCFSKGLDLTNQGPRYHIDELICSGFANVVDSLLAIKHICFDTKTLSLSEFLRVVKSNWAEDAGIRHKVLAGSFFGDESVESSAVACRFHEDLSRLIEQLPRNENEMVNLGYMLYTEMAKWALTMRATPDGRHDGDAFARGLTPSYLHHIKSVASVFSAMDCIDTRLCAANSVINITVPFRNQPLSFWDSLIRAIAASKVQALQINCVTKEELLEAQKHPEQYEHIVVRVCGFSAKFVSLSAKTQAEYLERNFFDC